LATRTQELDSLEHGIADDASPNDEHIRVTAVAQERMRIGLTRGQCSSHGTKIALLYIGPVIYLPYPKSNGLLERVICDSCASMQDKGNSHLGANRLQASELEGTATFELNLLVPDLNREEIHSGPLHKPRRDRRIGVPLTAIAI
jgi:hypothetical protein